MSDHQAPNLVDREFSWEAARALLDGLPGGQGLNIAHEAVDRHAAGPRADKVALRWLRVVLPLVLPRYLRRWDPVADVGNNRTPTAGSSRR